MTNEEFIKILNEINKKVIKDKNEIQTVTYINQKIKEIEIETDYSSDYIEKLIKDLK